MVVGVVGLMAAIVVLDEEFLLAIGRSQAAVWGIYLEILNAHKQRTIGNDHYDVVLHMNTHTQNSIIGPLYFPSQKCVHRICFVLPEV